MNAQRSIHPLQDPWERIQKLVRTEVKSPQDYVERVANGILIAKEFLEQQGQKLALSAEKVQAVHHFAFRDVYEWAGDFRKPHQVRGILCEVAFGLNKKYFGAPVGRIEPELIQLVNETKSFLYQARSHNLREEHKIGRTAEAIAYYHAGLDGVHPFLDGNSHVGRLLLDHHALVIFGREVTPGFNHAQYNVALDRAHSTGNLVPLRNQILEQCRQFDRVRAAEIEQQTHRATELFQSLHERGLDRSR